MKFRTNEVRDGRVMKILHFLLENTIFQNLLQDLEINVLFITVNQSQTQLTEEIRPKCLFFAKNIEDGKRVYEKVKPHIIILDVPAAAAQAFVEQIQLDIRIVVIWKEQDYFALSGLLAAGVRHFVMPPFTPQKILEMLHESLYEITLEREVQMQKSMVRAILEFQQDMLFFIEDDEIVDCNVTFLNFFGYEDLLSYQEENLVFADHFLDERGYYYPMNKWNWLDDCLAEPKKIKMKNVEGTEYVFLLRGSTLPEDGSRFVIICTDITQMEKENKENERLAVTDTLTNIYNRFKFQVLFAEEWEKAFLRDGVFSIILFDLDNFKNINDTYGNDAGDLALAQLAELVSAHIRLQDVFARWGGEEFVLLLPGSTAKEAFKVAEQLRFFIETKKFTGIAKLTASFGVAAYGENISRETLMQRAEAALKEAKQKGKNQVCLYRKEKK